MLANKASSTIVHLRNRLSVRCWPCRSIHGCFSPYASGSSSYPGNANNACNVFVIGAGQMGHGIAAACASAGHNVLISDRETERMEKAMKKIEALLRSSSSKGDGVLGQVSIVEESDWPGTLPSADLVVEAVSEDASVKMNLFEKLASETKKNCILASNTSSLSIFDLAVFRPERTIGLHFFNPVDKMNLIEVMHCLTYGSSRNPRLNTRRSQVVETDNLEIGVIDFAVNFVLGLGKEPIRCKDTPGFVVNRLTVPFWAQAMFMIDRGDADAPTIDKDFVGLDIVLSILEGWREKHGSEISQVPRCLKELVEKGHLGRKTGQGFYTWNNTSRSAKN